jgi:hypothetical protein
MESVVCVDIANFSEALTRGKGYDVLDRNAEKSQLKINGDNGRVRWYPEYCFTGIDAKLLSVKSIIFDDKIENPYHDAVEITLLLTQGDQEMRRWCYFLTPSYVYKLLDTRSSTPFTVGQHGMFLPVLTEENIRDSVNYLESHNMIEICTLPLSD